MIIVVDTNIVFSAILNPNGTIADLLLNSKEDIHFYSPSFILDELSLHHVKIKRISGLSNLELDFLKQTILRKIDLLNENYIQSKNWKSAFELTCDIDEKDTPFVALSLELNALLWTGDKKLSNGLKNKGVDWIIDSQILKVIRDRF